MYLLDTNVVSELRRIRPHGAVLAWLGSVGDENLHLSAVTIGEIQVAIEITREQDPDKATEITRNARDFEGLGVRTLNPFDTRDD